MEMSNMVIYLTIKTKIVNAGSDDDLKDMTPLEMAKQLIIDESICGICDLETAEVVEAHAEVQDD
jgi:hypothetical protein